MTTPYANQVAASVQKVLDAGGMRTPRGVLQPDAAEALRTLHDVGYAKSLTACIARALIEAAARE